MLPELVATKPCVPLISIFPATLKLNAPLPVFVIRPAPAKVAFPAPFAAVKVIFAVVLDELPTVNVPLEAFRLPPISIR